MSDLLIMRASDTLTYVAKNIFGDIVKTAHLSRYISGGVDSEFFKNTVYELDEAISQFDSGFLNIDLVDGINIIIEFINGAKVEFSTTEFGDLGKPQNVEEIRV